LTTEQKAQLIPHPATGEAFALDRPSEDLAFFLLEVREFEERLRQAKKLVGNELLKRMDKRGEWTMRVGGMEVRGISPAPSVEYDAQPLARDLASLADADLIDLETALEAVGAETVYKPNKRVLNRLKKLGGRVAETINRHSHEVEKERRPPSVIHHGERS
jgi:hypothetical protein